LIIMADQLGKSVGDMYKGAFIPGFALTALYLLYVLGVSIVKPSWAPALPPEARGFKEASGRSGAISLLVLTIVSVASAWLFAHYYDPESPLDELVVATLSVGIGVAFALAVVNRLLGLQLLSKMAEKVTFVLIPPLALIFLVLGTIFVGIATPTEGGAMGATGALIMALVRNRLSWKLLRQGMDSTAKLTAFVIFILVGARVFSLTFYGVNGHIWVEHLLSALPGGQLGFLIVVNILVFVLAFFLDFFELSFIIIPLLGPIADKLGIDLIWFGILMAVNMQTSFMHPPFGFALFFLRSVAPPTVKTTQIYWGAVPFVLIQIIMVGLLIAFPQIVTLGLDKKVVVDTSKVQIMIPLPSNEAFPGSAGALSADDDPAKAIEREMQKDDGGK